MSLRIYHNPRCSKSRQALALIEEAGVAPEIVKYLDAPLNKADIEGLLAKLGFSDPRQLMRTGEPIYKELGLKTEQNPDVLIGAMATYPKLIERPVVVKGDKALIGRPPERVSAFL